MRAPTAGIAAFKVEVTAISDSYIANASGAGTENGMTVAVPSSEYRANGILGDIGQSQVRTRA